MMGERTPDSDRTGDQGLCPGCGCAGTWARDASATGSPVSCRICGHRPAATIPGRPTTAVLPDPLDEESAWQAWQHSVRVERWIWFLFVMGLLVAGVVGLIRVG